MHYTRSINNQNKINSKSITHNIQDDYSFMCVFYCIPLIQYILAGETFLDYTTSFSPNDYKRNGNIVYKYFKYKYRKIKCK